MTINRNEKGNVLFLILIAVALFAALSYAVTQSTRTGGGGGDSETALISSAQLTQYPASVRTAVVRMILGGVDADDLEFNAASEFASCTSSNTFCVFHPSGGGATYAFAPVDMMASDGGNTSGQWFYNGENEIELLGTTGGAGPTVTTADIVAFLPGITSILCSRINKELGLPSVSLPVETGADYASNMVNPDGSTSPSIGATGGTIDADLSSDALRGQPFGCFVDTTQNPDVYVYYHVLVER